MQFRKCDLALVLTQAVFKVKQVADLFPFTYAMLVEMTALDKASAGIDPSDPLEGPVYHKYHSVQGNASLLFLALYP